MKKSKIALGVAAAFGVTTANAAVVSLVLTGANGETTSGTSSKIINLSTATWAYDTVTDVVTGTGLFVEQTQVAPIPGQLFTHHVTDLVVGGGGAASATSYSCVEGSFGGLVGASLCGNYSFTNFVNESSSSWGPGTAFSRTIGGDDASVGVQQNVNSNYDGMSGALGGSYTSSWDGNILVMSNMIQLDSGSNITFRLADWAVDDGPITVPANQTTNIDVLANDLPADDNIAALTVTAQPSVGSAAVSGTPPDLKGNLSIDYTAPPGFSGSTSFTYEVTDSLGFPDTATVTVSNLVPVAVDDATGTVTDTPVAIDVLANDTLGDAPDSIVDVTAAPTNGSITAPVLPVNCGAVPANCALTYTPGAGYNGPDAFTYSLTDNNGDVDTATVSITVAVGLAAIDDNATVDKNSSILIDVLANDVGLVTPAFGVDVTSGPTSGTITAPPLPVDCGGNPSNCALTYTPDPDAVGNDSFTYEVSDNGGAGATDTATVNVFINDLPVAVDDGLSANTGAATTLNVQANDTGLNDTPVSVTVTGVPANGMAVPDAGNPQGVTYTSAANFVGQDTFTYELLDSNGDTSNMATVTVDVDDQPVAVDDGTMGAPAFMVPEGTTLSLDVLANDTGLNDTPLTVSITSQGALGTTAPSGSPGDASTIRADYTAGMTPGVDSFDYQITDQSGDMSSATAYVAVTDADFPMAVDDAASGATGSPISINVLANDTGLADEPLTFTITTDPTNGSITFIQGNCTQQATCLVTYEPNAGFTGTDTYMYMVTDSNGDSSNIATVTITVNEAPVAVIDQAAATGVESTEIDVLANDMGLGFVPLTVTISTPPNIGTATVNGSPGDADQISISYTSNADTQANDTFVYTVTDDNGGSSSATVFVTITGSGGPVPPQDTLPGTSTALGPTGLTLLLAIPALIGRRRNRRT